MTGSDGRPPFDEAMAQNFVGKYVLIGITYFDSSGAALRLEQLHGVIVFVSRDTGIKVELKGRREGESKWFPPNIQSLSHAARGEYRLRETGEVLTDPDLLWTWNVTASSAG